jgi:hypothetical protein
VRTALSILLALSAIGCGRADTRAETERRNRWLRDLAYREDAGSSWELSTRDTVRIGDGWMPLEHLVIGDSRTVSWRWMGRHSTIQLDTGDGGSHHLLVGGGLPPGATSAVITYTLDGVVLDAHFVDKGWRLDAIIPPAMVHRRWVELGITSSSLVVPPGDARELGASLTTLRWEPAP